MRLASTSFGDPSRIDHACSPVLASPHEKGDVVGIPTRAEVDAAVRERLARDPEFRTQLLADPRGALSSLVEFSIPGSVTVEVHQESLAHVHLVIPAGDGDGEISDDELEMVAGGACWDDGARGLPGP